MLLEKKDWFNWFLCLSRQIVRKNIATSIMTSFPHLLGMSFRKRLRLCPKLPNPTSPPFKTARTCCVNCCRVKVLFGPGSFFGTWASARLAWTGWPKISLKGGGNATARPTGSSWENSMMATPVGLSLGLWVRRSKEMESGIDTRVIR